MITYTHEVKQCSYLVFNFSMVVADGSLKHNCDMKWFPHSHLTSISLKSVVLFSSPSPVSSLDPHGANDGCQAVNYGIGMSGRERSLAGSLSDMSNLVDTTEQTTKKEFEFSWISDEKRSLCAFLPSLSPLAHLTHQTYYVQFALGCPITLSKHLSVQN